MPARHLAGHLPGHGGGGEEGDHSAREWLGRHLLGKEPIRLLVLAADESGDFTAEKEIDHKRRAGEEQRLLSDGCSLFRK